MQQQLTKLKLLVKAELEILRLCLDCDSQSTMTSLIERNINKLDQELRNLELILCRFDERPQLSQKENDRLDTIKLNISKLLIQNEKIFNSEPQFREIVNQVPRIQNEDSVDYTQANTISIHNQSQNSKQALKNTPSGKISSQQGFYKAPQKEQGKQNISFQQSQKQSKQQQQQQQQQQSLQQNQQSQSQSQSQQSKQEQPVEMQQQYQIVRSNVDNLLNEMNKINIKIDTHKHDDYQRQIDKLRDDNSRIKADYQMLKQDNTELMFINNDIKKAISQIESENQLIIQELTILREQQYQPQTLTGQSRVSNIYLPYDENKAQEAEILLNRLKQN